MRFKKISIKNFRGIKEMEINDLSMINIFMGQNNSGKSSILEALFLLTGFHSPSLVLNLDLIRNLLHNEEKDFSFIFHNLDYSNKPTIAGELYENKGVRKLEIFPFNNSVKKRTGVALKEIRSPSTDDYESSSSTESDVYEEVNSLNFKTEIKEFQTPRIEYNSNVICTRNGNNLEFVNEPDTKKPKIDFKALYQPSNFRSSQELQKRLELLIREKNKGELVENLKLIESRITDITSFSNGMVYVDIGAKEMMPSNLMGDGFLKYLSTIVNLHEVKDGLLLIDELDNVLA